MKAQIIKSERPKEFKPFTLALTVESLSEARMLFHVFNHARLDELIKESGYWNTCGLGYSYDFRVTGGEVHRLIRSEIEDQGFKL